MAFPRLNALSYWLFLVSGIVLLSAFATNPRFASGWTLYPPLSDDRFTGFGMDVVLVSLILLGSSSILGAINFITTTLKLRAPGMTMFRLPLFVWAILITATLILLATPVLAAGLTMLLFDRNFGASFFDPAQGGSAVLWQHVFWFYSHPAVYIMILPAMGVVSEVLPVFSRKPVFGYAGMVFSLAAVGILGFMVWAHHMFTTDVQLDGHHVARLHYLPYGHALRHWLSDALPPGWHQRHV
jgi:cytochrome c oxidase subunit 1